ncbi:hypothetical protein [Desulfoplanes formicivorans]|uniref:Uncharacterized protein n=1 Tax=Desulfoplanes formicivorans TaxID=1592317 RepID=A0A194AG46_9BACT|nr:hypothetical protein [Desulfoplanes formicivorans]GAU09052.1 hypothetical protein DPF_1772 [Desulfoplanes formicivorans]
MGASINLPVMLNQTPHVQKMQHAAQSHPEHQQVLVAQEAVEKSKREQTSVPKTEKSQGGLSVKKDKDRKDEQSFSGSQDRDKKDKDQEQDLPATGSGRIINLTV